MSYCHMMHKSMLSTYCNTNTAQHGYVVSRLKYCTEQITLLCLLFFLHRRTIFHMKTFSAILFQCLYSFVDRHCVWLF